MAAVSGARLNGSQLSLEMHRTELGLWLPELQLYAQ